VILQLFPVESHSFHQNAQKLTGNTKNGYILNNAIKYSLFGSWCRNYLKSINTGSIFEAVMTEEN